MIKRLFIHIFLLSLGATAPAQPFSCDGRMFVSLLDQGQGTSALLGILPGDTLHQTIMTPIRLDLGVPIQVLGYNTTDNYLYGFNTTNYRMYRIAATGQLTDLGVPANLDTANHVYLAGEISPRGNSFLLVARSKTTGYDARFYNVRLNLPNLPAGYVSVISDQPVRLEDMAYDPLSGELVGFDAVSQRMVSVNTGGVITAGTFGPAGGIDRIGSVLFDRQGRLYAYGGRTNLHHSLYWFNRPNGRLLGTTIGSNGRNSDGTSCPYQIYLTKRIEPSSVLPCGEVTITYRFYNTAGTSYGQVRLTDTLPEGFTITGIERPPFIGEVESGVGTRIFDARSMQVLLGEDSCVIQARVGLVPPGLYGSQAVAGPFSPSLGNQLYSDDPSTPWYPNDATLLKVLPADSILADTVAFFCSGSSIELRPTVQGRYIRWSTGAETPVLHVDRAGMYWIEVEEACGIFRDSIQVREINTGLRADLGPDRQVVAGTPSVLSVQHNSIMPLRYRWEALSNDPLSCFSCPLPSVSPLQNSSYAVTVTDAFGCTASDTLSLRIKTDVPVFVPNVFSPDDNGVNDVLYPQGPEGISIDYFQVFDRWGGQVFRHTGGRVNDPAYGWDGKYKGRPAPQGAYLWVLRLRYADGAVKDISGEVYLAR